VVQLGGVWNPGRRTRGAHTALNPNLNVNYPGSKATAETGGHVRQLREAPAPNSSQYTLILGPVVGEERRPRVIVAPWDGGTIPPATTTSIRAIEPA